jgi:glutamate-1-semialdehyde 2,1-aminomutase
VTSGELYARALKLIPGGVNSPVRAMKAVGLEEPLFAARGEGAYLEDVDGRRYVDWVLSWGPLIFGHADPETVEAVVEAARDGTSFGTATEREVELAEEIVAAVPSVEMVRLVSSGTEAAMTALRLARRSSASAGTTTDTPTSSSPRRARAFGRWGSTRGQRGASSTTTTSRRRSA